MNFISLLPVLYGLGAAGAWGAGDFAGGLAARRRNALAAVFHAEWLGIIGVLGAAWLYAEPMLAARVWLWAMLAGAIGSAGLVLLYQAMSDGQMSIAAPVSALVAAILPVTVSAVSEGLPGWEKIIGFGLALLAVWLVSTGESGPLGMKIASWQALRLPFLAGIAFGLYFVLMRDAGRTGLFWPLVASRSGGMAILAVYAGLTRSSLRVSRPVWPVMLVNAVMDVTANGLYVLAGQVGRLDVAAVLGSLYPGVTVLLAWLVLKERIRGWQKLGIALALAAIGLIAG